MNTKISFRFEEKIRKSGEQIFKDSTLYLLTLKYGSLENLTQSVKNLRAVLGGL